MDGELLQVEAEINKVVTKSNRALRLQVDTQENVTDEMISKLVANHGKYGWFTFLVGKNQIQPQDIVHLPELPNGTKKKSLSKQLRDVLYHRYQQKGTSTASSSDEYYELYMNQLIQKIKDDLD